MNDLLTALAAAFQRRWDGSVVSAEALDELGDADYLHELATTLEPPTLCSVAAQAFFYLRSGSWLSVRKLTLTGDRQPDFDDLAWMVEAGEREQDSAPGLIWVKATGDAPHGAGEKMSVLHAYLTGSSIEVLYQAAAVEPYDGEAEEADDLFDEEQAIVLQALIDYSTP